MVSKNKKRISVTFENDSIELLTALAEANKISLSELISNLTLYMINEIYKGRI